MINFNKPFTHLDLIQSEYSSHEERDESVESALCKLHIKVLTHGNPPKNLIKTYKKHSNGQKILTLQEQEDVLLLERYLEQYALPTAKKNGKGYVKWLTLYQSTLLLALCEFIDNPKHCHQGRFNSLLMCKSPQYGLQHKQRVALVKTIVTLFTMMNIETGYIGHYPSNPSDKMFDDNGFELFQGITHYAIQLRYKQLWKESISKTKYFNTLNMLKSEGLLEIIPCYINETTTQEDSAETTAIPLKKIHSKAAYKWFTDKFFDLFSVITKAAHMIKSKTQAIGKRIKENCLLRTRYTKHTLLNGALVNIDLKNSPQKHYIH